MREFIIVHLLEPVKIGTRFTMWPLHMTLLPWFEALDAEVVERAIRKSLAGVKPLRVTVGDRASGLGKGPAMLINNTPELQRLHEQLVQMTVDSDWNLQGRYTGKLFKPHVVQKAGHDARGAFDIRELYIAESQAQGYRQIVGKVALA